VSTLNSSIPTSSLSSERQDLSPTALTFLLSPDLLILLDRPLLANLKLKSLKFLNLLSKYRQKKGNQNSQSPPRPKKRSPKLLSWED